MSLPRAESHLSPSFCSENRLFRFARHGSLASVLRDSDFREISEEFREIAWVWDGTPEEQFRSFSETSAPFRKMFSALDRVSQQRASEKIVYEIGKYYDGKQVNLGAMINTAAGKKIVRK